jgi:hypothetical protein
MNISDETPEQTQARLLLVLARAAFRIYEETYTFEEFPLDRFAEKVKPNALAYVRDETIWSQLIPASEAENPQELFKIFSFHFPEGLDNSGFVGWLASRLKQSLGTGVFVICGQNSDRGGIFDYWGCPAEIGQAAIAEVESAIAQGQKGSQTTASDRFPES